MGSSWPRRAGFRYPRRDFLSASTRMTFLCVEADRKSTRLNSSHGYISYAVFCLKKKKLMQLSTPRLLLRRIGAVRHLAGPHHLVGRDSAIIDVRRAVWGVDISHRLATVRGHVIH